MVQKYSAEVQNGIWKVLRWLLVFEFFMVFGNNVFNLITPKLAEEFSVAPSTVSLVISLGVLAFGISSVVFTILSDRISMSQLLLYPSAAVSGIALLALLADQSFVVLIAFRVLMGLAMGSPVALCLNMAIKYFDKLTAAKFFGYATAVFQLAAATGHLLGGYLTEHFHWKLALMLPVVTVLSLPTLIKYLPKEVSKKGTFDFVGAGLVTAFVVSLVLYLTFKMQYPIMLISALVVLAILIVYSLKKENPFINPEIFKIKGVPLSLIVCLLFYGTQSAFYFIFPFIVKDIYNMPLTTIGVFYTVTNLVAFVVGMLSGPIIKAIGYRNMVLLGGSLIFAGLATVAFLSGYTVVTVFAGMAIFNIGYVLFFSGYLSNYTQLLPVSKYGAGVGIEKLVLQTSTSLGTAGMALLINQPYMMHKLVDFSDNVKSAQFSNMALVLMGSITVATIIFLKVFSKSYNCNIYDVKDQSVEKTAY